MPRAIAAALLAAAVALGACGGNDHKASSTPKKPLPAKPAPADIAPGGGLAIGMTEINPDLFWHGKDVGAFTPWRDRFEALKPPLYRLVVDWSSLQPKQGGAIDWSVDGAPFLSWTDPAPLAGAGHEHLAFNDWEADVSFDNLAVRPAGP